MSEPGPGYSCFYGHVVQHKAIFCHCSADLFLLPLLQARSAEQFAIGRADSYYYLVLILVLIVTLVLLSVLILALVLISDFPPYTLLVT